VAHFHSDPQVRVAIVEREHQRQTIANVHLTVEPQPEPARTQVDDRGLQVAPGTTRPASSPGGNDLKRDTRQVAAQVFGFQRTTHAQAHDSALAILAIVSVNHISSIGWRGRQVELWLTRVEA
jgi:hypothetical protein